MPRSSKKAGGRLSRQKTVSETEGDVTLNDFANSRSARRLKKPTTNALVREVKQIKGSTDNSLACYEKDFDYFEPDIISPLDQEEEDCDNKGAVMKTRRSRRKKINTEPREEGGCSYPIDIWYLISDYIKPEDVATFACICKSANYVINSPRFWLSTYRRYYNSSINLPDRLQPDCIVQLYSLRACSIRALFYLYPPFVDRLRPTAPFDAKPHTLVKLRCCLMWHQKVKNVWNFFFKFHSDSHSSRRESSSKSYDLMHMLDDINANSEDGYKVLQVTCQNFMSLPMVMGMVLASVTFNVSQEMHHYRLRLIFMPTGYGSIKAQITNGVVVTLEPVTNIRILNWWHPQYPFPAL